VEKDLVESKEHAAMDWIMDEESEITIDNPIYEDVCKFVRGLVEENRNRREEIERQIAEEQQWRGGHEEGMSDMEE
jgi:hypothetical protein